ncbi:CDP-glycerol glycerophosphotransferase family protein [Alkalibacterium kapii]|uniref:Teichoic acid biosynthesis protein B n=1 Tax=Alkalibacterium kapii TaxID=426704 RepID=A0A511AS57_9LACT|nr:CDP-glycerol glycerophosphotransferase family protein [Alkalibacterium kapii]GEK91034.1 hypothetical protein AKA01nite_06560 [Alkalibacterium kapii]
MRHIQYIKQMLKFFLAFVICKTILRSNYSKKIWLIGEKKTEARDNAYHLFKYIRENHPEINAHYVISNDSPDLYKIEKYGNLVSLYSMKHYIYYLTSSKLINSQLSGAFPFWHWFTNAFPFLKNKSQHSIYLKHGVYKDEMDHKVDYSNTQFSLVSCVGDKEKKFFIDTYGYPESVAQSIGLCRFDNLPTEKTSDHRQILVMPTFRNWLVSKNRMEDASDNENSKFIKSEFFKNYLDFFNSEELEKILSKYNYKVVFYPHYSIQSYSKVFKEHINPNIIVADRFHYDVQELLINSSILVTDFSSVFFDFAYMGKPVIYYQFDKENYRKNHYKKGYFNYDSDGFGNIVGNTSDLISEVEECIVRDLKLPCTIKKRVDEFFEYRDNNNCKRTFEFINNL